MTLSNIACHYPNCTKPVIGQCSGYKGKCGRFFCAEHCSEESNNPLCSICYDRLMEDAGREYIYTDYLEESEKLGLDASHNMGCIYGIWLAILAPFVFGGFGLLFGASDPGVGLPKLLGVLPFLFLILITYIYLRQRKIVPEKFQRKVEDIDQLKPGFREFHDEWQTYTRKKNTKQTLALGLNTLIVSGLAADAISEALKENKTRRDIHDIAERMRR